MKTMLLALLISGCAQTIHWTANVTEVAALGSLACDAGSTHDALTYGGGRFYETNPIMGAQPTTNQQVAYFGGVTAGLVGINYAFTKGQNHVAGDVWRILANVLVTGVEYYAVKANTDVGVPLCGI